MPTQYDAESGRLTLRLYIQPKSSRDCILGVYNNKLKICITAAPAEGAANQHLIKFLSKQFNVSKSAVIIEKGIASRHKHISILHPRHFPDNISALLNA